MFKVLVLCSRRHKATKSSVSYGYQAAALVQSLLCIKYSRDSASIILIRVYSTHSPN